MSTRKQFSTIHLWSTILLYSYPARRIQHEAQLAKFVAFSWPEWGFESEGPTVKVKNFIGWDETSRYLGWKEPSGAMYDALLLPCSTHALRVILQKWGPRRYSTNADTAENLKLFRNCLADLPEFRMTAYVPPFAHTGLDFFGPMLVKIGRRQEKRCLNSRAILNWLCYHSNKTFPREDERRGDVKVMYSDNGTNLRGAEAELKKALLELDGNSNQQHRTSVVYGNNW
jgi:hypothetical protein